ncbi:hypothetical protein [Paenibacillus alkalitolerans]|uniref:hypothetical protein n=1 Tax=Paenibacillus alkalitolerans TaxID=2799335 RepID=UPI0018F7B6A5|nr:hypothetical protein [Paenibacillus alkalitolerans]
MNTKNEINQCIEECERAFANLRNALGQLPDGPGKIALGSAADHLGACIQECRNSLNQM